MLLLQQKGRRESNQLILQDLKSEAQDSAFSSALGSFGSAIVSGFFQPSNLKFFFGG